MWLRSDSDFGALVRSERKKRDWTQKELAGRVGVSAVWMSQIERGKPTAHFGLILKTLQALEIPLWAGELPGGPGKAEEVVDLDSLVES